MAVVTCQIGALIMVKFWKNGLTKLSNGIELMWLQLLQPLPWLDLLCIKGSKQQTLYGSGIKTHLSWQQQRDLDAQLATDVLNLQHTVSWLGDQLTVLSTKSVLKCDWNSSQ
ncbi:endogenous retrovirus group K member 13-1 Env polyprotein-like [Hyaena hyaena]|uniref:endogenous retrovirus group K member 13-1 Env polyprotein-like n=1 Tax=Hyaena hyaena TaxID=95912 RepID=UPI001920BA45|nr:endogenous retrovirus group K member 13-1 Env polyprotein-like [Hyaena hyaena]